MKERGMLLLAVLLCLDLCAPAGAASCVDAGDVHTAAVSADGSLWTWGGGSFGQLGAGDLEDAFQPLRLLDGVESVACGGSVTAAVLTDGSLWMWGDGQYGQLGAEAGERSPVPVRVMEDVTAAACGDGHVAALRADGSLWMWGRGDCGQLGCGLAPSGGPVKVMDGVAAVSCGGKHTAAIRADGSLWTWGGNGCGQLGVEGIDRSAEPVKVMDGVVAVSCGGEHTAAVRADGSLWMWGNGRFGQLGTGAQEGSSVPVKVLDGVRAVACGFWHTAAVKADGSLWTWGYGQFGQLGSGGQESSSVPVKVLEDVTAAACGLYHTAAVKTDGSLWTWGYGRDGQLGCDGGDLDLGGQPIQSVPRQVEGLTVKSPDRSRWALPVIIGEGIDPDPEGGTADENRVTVLVDGQPREAVMYALGGGATNYIRLRDLADLLDGTAAQFNVTWDEGTGAVGLEPGLPYTDRAGDENAAEWSGPQPYERSGAAVSVAGVDLPLTGLSLQDGGANYYRLRDLGQALGFNVGWSDSAGLYVQTGAPYDYAQ